MEPCGCVSAPAVPACRAPRPFREEAAARVNRRLLTFLDAGCLACLECWMDTTLQYSVDTLVPADPDLLVWLDSTHARMLLPAHLYSMLRRQLSRGCDCAVWAPRLPPDRHAPACRWQLPSAAHPFSSSCCHGLPRDWRL